MISLWKLREKKNVAQMPFVKNTPAILGVLMEMSDKVFDMVHLYKKVIRKFR